MSLRKFLLLLCVFTLSLAVACGGGKEVADEELGEDDVEELGTVASETAAGAAPAASAAAANPDAATVVGLVKLEGGAPQMPPMQMGADPFCASQHSSPLPDEEVVLGPGGELANVLVYVKDAPAGGAPPGPALLDQKGCKYIPHVSAVMVGQPLQIKNSDNTLHNVNAQPKVNARFNEGQPVQGMVSTKKFDKPEMTPFRIKCDVHGWMKSYMAVLPHPYHAVSQMNGNFTIANLPPGNYTLVAWHEKYGQQEQQVTVGPKESKQVSFTFRTS